MNYLTYLLKHKYLSVLLLLLFTGIVGSGVTRLTFVADLKVFFGKDNPQLVDLQKFEDTFSKHGTVLFAINSKTEKDVFNRKALTALKELTKASWAMPYSSRVTSMANFSHSWAEGDELIIEELITHPETLSDEELQKIRKIALAEPLLVNTQVSLNGDLALVWVTITTSTESVKNNKEIVSYSENLAKTFRKKYPDLGIRVSGSEVFNFAYAKVSADDMKLLYPIMFVLMAAMMFFLIPSASGVFSTLVIVMVSAVAGMGAAGWMGIPLTSASSAAPVIILTLAVADSIHLLVSMLYFMRQGMSKIDAIKESLRINMQPVFLTSVTTAVGFLSMISCDSPPFQDLGKIVAVGVMAAFFYSVTLLPVLMAILPVKQKKTSHTTGHHKFLDMDKLGAFVIARRKLCLWISVVLMLILSVGFFRLEISDNFMEYFDERYEVRQVADYIEDHIPAMGGIEYLLDSGEEGGINDPEFLRSVEAFTNWCSAQPEVSQVRSMLFTVKTLNMNMHGDDPAYYVIPDSRELVAQFMLLYEMSLPFGQDMNGSMTPDRSMMRFTVIQKRLTTKELRAFEDRAQQWLSENWTVTDVPRATGMGIMFAHISERNIKSMVNSTVLALLIISFILIFSFRSLKIGLFSLIPNLIPAAMTFGLWGLLSGYVNMAVSYIAAMSLGIVVDDTVHFLSKYLRAKREMGLSSHDAVQYSFHTVGQALLTTSLVLASGFLVLFFSGFEVNSVMGILMSIAIVFALAADLFLLPPLLLYLEGGE
jgi:predicted RND superfamily exporter protein